MDWRQMNNIENIWQFLENLNEYVYATDIETNELVYMNRKALDAYELKSLEEIRAGNAMRSCRNPPPPVAYAITTGFVSEPLRNGATIIR